MGSSNFSERELAGKSELFAREVDGLKTGCGFDFVSLGLTAFIGAPLRWVYSAGATGERHRRIVLAPGHGIGGITVKAGKPMMFTDIDREIDPREYSSYPIVFAEDLHSFCALPLTRKGRVVAVLLCAFRSVSESNEAAYRRLLETLQGAFCGLDVVSSDFMDFQSIAAQKRVDSERNPIFVKSELSRVIAAQEDERKRISRELHDGIAQELLSMSFVLKRLAGHVDQEGAELLAQAGRDVDRILDDLHNLSVELRPSALDHLGFLPALHSQAAVFERTYGTEIVFEGELSCDRFDQALETQAYRICQEAILNACKYSGSERVVVSIEDSGGWLHACVSDEGCGFNTAKPEIKGSGCGLLGMQERASVIGARLSMESNEHGTKMTLVAPMRVTEGNEVGA